MSSLNAGFDCVQHLRVRPASAIYFSRNHSSDKLIIFLDSRLDTQTSKFLTQDSKLEVFEFRGSSLEARGSRDCQLTFERYCILGVVFTRPATARTGANGLKRDCANSSGKGVKPVFLGPEYFDVEKESPQEGKYNLESLLVSIPLP